MIHLNIFSNHAWASSDAASIKLEVNGKPIMIYYVTKNKLNHIKSNPSQYKKAPYFTIVGSTYIVMDNRSHEPIEKSFDALYQAVMWMTVPLPQHITMHKETYV